MLSNFKNIVYLSILILLITILSACPTPQQYPIEPQLTFKQIILSDTVDLLGNDVKIFKLRFGIIDGDGDIGLMDSDTSGVYHPDSLYNKNLFTILFEIIDGDTVEVDPEKQRNFRVPYVEPQGQNKTLIAEIYIDIEFTFQQSGELPYDSIMYNFYIVDRKFNKSNIEKTPVIKLDTIGIFPPVLEE
ncbi:MAG: hypothetical protein K8R54_12770 [Bacteroidales bacterium]|nr:hypothetical protein [Bacteroidales bacterium]